MKQDNDINDKEKRIFNKTDNNKYNNITESTNYIWAKDSNAAFKYAVRYSATPL
jgi:hypothetical protein